MNVQMGIGHGNALLIEDLLHPLVYQEIHIPIVVRFGPDPEGILNGTFSVAGDHGHGSGLQQGIVHSACQHQSVNDLLGGHVIGSGYGNIHPPGGFGTVIDDLCGNPTGNTRANCTYV